MATSQNSKQQAEFELRILGCGSAKPTLLHNPSSQVIFLRGRCFMIDCGEGTQLQMTRYGVSSSSITDIFISHLHGDHFLGLPGLLGTMCLDGRTKPLRIYTFPEGIDLLKHIMKVTVGEIAETLISYYPLNSEKKESILDDTDMKVESFPLNHRVPTCGFIFREKPYGKKNVDKPMVSYAYCSDTIFYPTIIESIKGVDTLFHEATYNEKMKHKAAPRGHSTACEAGEIATLADARNLIIGHYSKSIRDEAELEREAETKFNGKVYAAFEGMRFDLRKGLLIND